MNNLKWKKYHPLTDQNAFICLVDHMGDDSAIVQAARVSYGKDEQEPVKGFYNEPEQEADRIEWEQQQKKDRQLIRYLMNHQHTTPFEMVEFKFMVQVPMDCWRQWIRHRTASVNEYSTRYTEALDFFQVTDPTEWRLQAIDNKQGSSGYVTRTVSGLFKNVADFTEVFDRLEVPESTKPIGEILSELESKHHTRSERLYKQRLACGVAKEQARKDLPLSTYTRAYWKCDLHNIFNFLRLRMDSHAQQEIRSFANSMFEIVRQICPVACEAFEDYVLNAKKFSKMEMEFLKEALTFETGTLSNTYFEEKPDSMTDREWKEFLEKLT